MPWAALRLSTDGSRPDLTPILREPANMPSAAITDPAVKQFVAKITASAAAAPDAIAGLLLKLCARVSTLEMAAKAQARQLDQLSRQSHALLPPGLLAAPPIEPEAEDGARARRAVKHPVGRPKGGTDSRPRRMALRPVESGRMIDP